MRSSGNPARLWPPSKRHFLYPLGSGLPVSVISFMEYPGLFPGMCKIDAKTNKTCRFEYFYLQPHEGTPLSEKMQKMESVGSRSESIFSSFGCGNVSPQLHPVLFRKISYNILQLVQVLVHMDTGAKKLRGPAVAGDDHAILDKKLLFSTWALCSP